MEQASSASTADTRAPTIHTALDSVARVTPPFEQAIRKLNLIGRRKAMAALFGERVTRQAVINWRKSRRTAPSWAIEALTAAVARERESFANLESLLRAELEKRKG